MRPSARQALAAKSFKTGWRGTTSLRRTLCAAVHCGAFERPRHAGGAREELDEMLSRLNGKYHGVSEISTDAGVDEPTQRQRL